MIGRRSWSGSAATGSACSSSRTCPTTSFMHGLIVQGASPRGGHRRPARSLAIDLIKCQDRSRRPIQEYILHCEERSVPGSGCATARAAATILGRLRFGRDRSAGQEAQPDRPGRVVRRSGRAGRSTATSRGPAGRRRPAPSATAARGAAGRGRRRGPASRAVAVEPLLARQQPVERGQQVVVRAGADLDDDEARGRVRHEDRQQPVAAVRTSADERRARAGQVDQSATAPRPDVSSRVVYGKMLRIASRSRPERRRRPAPTRSAAARRRPGWRRPTGGARRPCCSSG